MYNNYTEIWYTITSKPSKGLEMYYVSEGRIQHWFLILLIKAFSKRYVLDGAVVKAVDYRLSGPRIESAQVSILFTSLRLFVQVFFTYVRTR